MNGFSGEEGREGQPRRRALRRLLPRLRLTTSKVERPGKRAGGTLAKDSQF